MKFFHLYKNNPWAGLGPILAVAYTLGEDKDVHSSIKFRLYYNSFAPALGGACAMGKNTIALIQAF